VCIQHSSFLTCITRTKRWRQSLPYTVVSPEPYRLLRLGNGSLISCRGRAKLDILHRVDLSGWEWQFTVCGFVPQVLNTSYKKAKVVWKLLLKIWLFNSTAKLVLMLMRRSSMDLPNAFSALVPYEQKCFAGDWKQLCRLLGCGQGSVDCFRQMDQQWQKPDGHTCWVRASVVCAVDFTHCNGDLSGWTVGHSD